MKTECSEKTGENQERNRLGEYEFRALDRRKVVGKFDGGMITSDGGGLLLREVDDRLGIVCRFAECFTDHRDQDLIEHSVEELLSQRVYGLALGYDDLCDHDTLRHDHLLATLVGKKDPMGLDRREKLDRGKPLAGKSTLNRLELTKEKVDPANRYQKIVADHDKIERFFVEQFLASRQAIDGAAPERIVLDLDATDDPLHGDQMGKFFHGYYGCYCYLPLYVFCGDDLLCAQLRPSNIDAAAGALDEIKRIVAQIRERWPKVKIVLRADSGFCREEIMAWCEEDEQEGVYYLFGLAKNSRLGEILSDELSEAKAMYEESGHASRVFKDFRYKTLKSWSRDRRVVGKAEHLAKGANPRFVVTSITSEDIDARTLYEKEYCARGEMENRIKEQQLDMFADRTSSHWMRSNQLRLWLSSVAYTLVSALRTLGLRGTEMARAQCGTIRQRLLKIGAQVKVSVRRVLVSFASACPYQKLFERVWRNLRKFRPRVTRNLQPTPVFVPQRR
jgi:hypothetical protein